MKHLNTFVLSLLVVIMTSFSISCGGSNLGIAQPDQNGSAAQENLNIDELQTSAGMPDIASLEELFAQEAGQDEKGVSWLSHPNHLAPVVSFNGGIDPGDPNCYLLKGFKGAVVGGPNGPQIAYAIYQIPLGATEVDLLDMKVAAQISSATETYYAGIADFSAMHWDFAGPLNAPDWTTDMTSLGYDFTGAAGNMYIALVAMPDTNLHITDITLNFKDNEEPTEWNVWGKAFESYATGSAHGGADVIFKDINSAAWFVTLADANGNWGMNLPTGEYDFWVIGNEMLIDTTVVPTQLIDMLPDGLGTRLDLDGSGQIVYQGSNAVYTGNVVPMPLITANQF